MNNIKHLIFILIMSAFFTSCYKDIGNYTYTDINQVSIKLDKEGTINILQFDTLKVNVQLTETITPKDGYEYQWVLFPRNTPLERRVVGTEKELKARITEVPGTYTLNLFVKDKTTGVETILSTPVNISGKYADGWLVLDEVGGGKNLSIINRLGVVFSDVYGEANDGAKLLNTAHAVEIVRDRLGTIKVFVMAENDLHQLNHADFLEIGRLDDIFWAIPEDRNPVKYFVRSGDEMLINNKKPFGLSTMVPAPYKFGSAPDMDFTVAPFEFYDIRLGFVLYDEKNQKFVRLSIPSSIVPLTQTDVDNAVFNMNDIGKKLIFAEESSAGIFSMLFKDNDSDQMYAYVADLTKPNQAVSKTPIQAIDAPHVLEASKYVMAKMNPHMYYAYKNQLYLLDFPAAKARIVHTFPTGAEITAAELYYNGKVPTEADNNRLLVVGTHENGEGKVYTLPLTATGDIEGGKHRELFSGFGKIKDIAYKRIP